MIVMPVIICALGTFLMFKLRAFFILHPWRTASAVLPYLKNKESRESFFLALGGTLGVGNIFGVSLGIIVGGVGSIFWIAVSAFLSMMIKYAEVVLGFSVKSVRYGMPSVIRESMGEFGKPLSSLYAVFGILLSLFMGALMQSRSITDTASAGGIDGKITLVAVLIFTMYFVIFGSDKIKKIIYYIIPLTTIVYILLAFLVVFCNFERLGDAIKSIFESAFSFRSVSGGALGALVHCGFRDGFLRGVMSNEAGAGTSLMGHSAEPTRPAGVAGVFGILEVLFDTLVICPLTGIAIAVSGVPIEGGAMQLVSSAFSCIGEGFIPALLLALVFCFAYSTIMSLYYYGMIYTEYLKIPRWLFSLSFILFILFSPIFPESFVGAIDIILLLMILPTAYCLIKNVGMIGHHTDEMLNLK